MLDPITPHARWNRPKRGRLRFVFSDVSSHQSNICRILFLIMFLGKGVGVTVVAGVTLGKSLNSYERGSDYVGSKPTVKGELACKALPTFASRLRTNTTRRVMKYKRFSINVFEREPGKWRARITPTLSRRFGPRSQLANSVNYSLAVEAMTKAMEMIDAVSPLVIPASQKDIGDA
jgi:hypothetical protein